MIRVGKDSYFIGAKGGWYDPRIEHARKAFFREANRKKIKFIQLFDVEVKNWMPNFPKYFEGNLEYRFLPKEYSTNSAIHVFGDYVVTYTGLTIGKIDEHIVFFIIRSKDRSFLRSNLFVVYAPCPWRFGIFSHAPDIFSCPIGSPSTPSPKNTLLRRS